MTVALNSVSPFRELRLAAGYSQVKIAEILNLDRNTIGQWESGKYRPRWRYIPDLAQALRINPDQAVKLFWKEAPGDPCGCGCGGEKIFPTREGSRHLYTKLPCKQCGAERIFRVMQKHVDLCKRCSYASRKVGRVKLTCVGYRAYGARSRAKNCPRETERLPNTLNNWRNESNDELTQRVFVDKERGEYRCRWCAGAYRMLMASQKKLKTKWAEVRPSKNFPRIRSLDDLKQVQGQLTHVYFKNRQSSHPGHYEVSPEAAYARWWRRKNFVGPVRGLCEVSGCNKILFSYKKSRPMRFHQRCLLDYQREHGMQSCPPERPPAHRPVTLEALQRHVKWAVRYKILDDSYADISKEFKVAKSTVVDGITFVTTHLPADEDVPKDFLDLLSRLRSPKNCLTVRLCHRK